MNREMSGPHFMHKEGRYELMGFGRSWFCREQAKRRVEGGGGGAGWTRSGTEKRRSHNLQSGHPAWWSAEKCGFLSTVNIFYRSEK